MQYIKAPKIQNCPTKEISKAEIQKLINLSISEKMVWEERPTVRMPALKNVGNQKM